MPIPILPSGNPVRSLVQEGRVRALALAGAVAAMLALPASLPAPDLKLLPAFPKNLFKKTNEDLQETAQAPAGPAGMCILPSGEYIVSAHPFFFPQHRVMKRAKDGEWSPFPNEAMNTPGSGDPRLLDSVIGVACDPRGIVWMLDNGRRSGTDAKLVAWDTKRDELHRVLVIDGLALIPGSFLTNLVLDPVAPFVYLSDPADGLNSAIIVVDTHSGLCRRVLQGDRSVQKDPAVELMVGGEVYVVRRPDGTVAYPLTGVSPLAIDRKGEWLYYGPRDSTNLYKIKTELLTRPDIAPHVLSSQVTGVSPKPICDSMVIDARGFIYFGDIGNSLIDYVDPGENYLNLREFAKDPRITWPGGLLIGPDGQLHFYNSQLHRTSFFNDGKDVTAPPFSLFKARLPNNNRFGF